MMIPPERMMEMQTIADDIWGRIADEDKVWLSADDERMIALLRLFCTEVDVEPPPMENERIMMDLFRAKPDWRRQ
jgi:hypothetical protein